MKRLHVHISVDDLARSIDFYSTLFGAGPGLVKHDYAKWLVEDPRVNFTISKRDRAAGLDHLGIQVEDAAALAEISQRMSAAGATPVEQKNIACCYARSDKAWVNDPQGIAWETFLSHGEAAEPSACGEDGDCGGLPAGASPEPAGGCCATTSCGAPAGTPAEPAGTCCA